MDYFDDDEFEYYYEYDETVEPIYLVADYFSEKELTDTLMSSGLIFDRNPKYVGNMEKLVFVYGEKNEVYSSAEIQFIEQIHQVFVYSEFSKKLNKYNSMSCRLVVAKLDCSARDALLSCISFEKIINKALDGFNIFFFVTKENVYFGCRIFDSKNNRDCALSNPIYDEAGFEQVLEELSSISEIDSFIEYYEHIKYTITYVLNNKDDYDSKIIQRRGVQISYLDDMDEIGRK